MDKINEINEINEKNPNNDFENHFENNNNIDKKRFKGKGNENSL